MTEEQAREAVRKIKVEYEVLPHFVREADLAAAGAPGKGAGESVIGDPDQAMKEAEAVSEGTYGIPVINHCCLEPHGQIIQWAGDNVNVWPSTQNVTQYATTLAPNIKVPAANIKVKMDYIGGGFGSKFSPDAWATVGANLSKKAGGTPVKMYLDRAPEQRSRATGRRHSPRSKSAARRTARSRCATRCLGYRRIPGRRHPAALHLHPHSQYRGKTRQRSR